MMLHSTISSIKKICTFTTRSSKNTLNYRSVMLLAVLLLLFLSYPSLAADSKSRVLKVAFPQVTGISETAVDGTRHGVVVDYLNEISKYTNWEYEYIDVDNGTSMITASINGEYDLIGGQYYIAGLEEYYGYPIYNIGYSRSTLLARRNDRSIRSSNLESMNGKTIGVYANARENIRRLKEFLSINGLNCTIKEYTYDQFSVNDNLYSFLENGEVDLLLGNSFDGKDTLRVVASFNSQPYYIVTTSGNQDILDGLNMALERITDANPNFGEERYKANFPNVAIDIQLTDKELEYVQRKGTVTVAVPDGWHPLFSLTDENVASGVVPDLLKKISEFTGLEFKYIYADSYIDTIHMVQKGQADVMAFFLDSEAAASQRGLALSAAYSSMDNIVVRNKASTYPADGLAGSIIEGQTLPSEIQAAEILQYADFKSVLSKVNRGEIDFAYGLSTQLEQAIQQYHFSNLVPVNLANDNSDICFALARPVDPDLLTIINKAINSLSSEEKISLLSRNMISIGTSTYSLMELIYADPVAFVVILTVVLFILVLAILLTARSRMKATVMQSNFEKAEADSRARGEFLSRMSHEIRTPMNAVVGLADLTSMMDDVPDKVRENLSKIRSSSQYLLSLINDILEMSRIDNGMLSIASEQFYMEQTLDNLQSMMSAEAQRRGISFTVDKDIVHNNLIGDAIRLRQVLTNLLSNAFKFTPEGGNVLLRAIEAAEDKLTATFTFQVIDNGVGIRKEDQKRIFDSFEQLGTSSSQSQGTGLGLPISSNIVRLMGGELRLKSELGRGSEFYFTVTIPLNNKECITESSTTDVSLDGIHILLAEDNDLNAEIAIQLLEIRGASVRRSENGKLAVEQFERSRPGEFQAILMDIQMPVMNGLEATRAIRAMARADAAQIPIIAMTASSFKEDIDAAQAAGMNGFVSKPLDVAYLYRVLQDLLK